MQSALHLDISEVDYTDIRSPVHTSRLTIRSAAVGRTVMIVAHRLATVVEADQIIVLDAGRITATGTHTELLSTSALYQDLAQHQLLDGRTDVSR